MFNPPSPRRSSAFSPTPGYPPVHPQSLPPPTLPNVQPQTPPPAQPQTPTQTPQQPNRPKREAPTNQNLLQRVIPPEEDMRRLFQECRFAHGNAQLLSEALAFASPEDLRDKDIIKVRHTHALLLILARTKVNQNDVSRSGTPSVSLPRN